MNQLTYAQLHSRLFSINIHGGMKLALQNPLALDQLSDFPSKAFHSVHIAGSNGKGSVSTKLAAAFEAAGWRTGLYTSPHIACWRERMRINRQMISEEEARCGLIRLFELAAKQQIPATFFEFTTALAFSWFAQQKVQMAIVETGLGGRLDATNILQPQLSIITSISLEHTEILGITLEAITREKCGIIKDGVPILIGPRVPESIVQEHAARCGSPVIRVDGEFADYHAENQAVARRALQLLQVPYAAIEAGIDALPPCRLELFTKEQIEALGAAHGPLPTGVIFDVAHNPDGFLHLQQALHKRFPGQKLRFLIGMSKNKDIKACFALFKEMASPIHLVQAENPRAAPVQELKSALRALQISEERLFCETSVSLGMHNALQLAAIHGELLIVCGTFFIMAAARRALGIQEPTDLGDPVP